MVVYQKPPTIWMGDEMTVNSPHPINQNLTAELTLLSVRVPYDA